MIAAAVRKKLAIYPLISCLFHEIYAFLIAFNCAFLPWGRFFGLLANTMAICIFSIGSRFKHYLLVDDNDNVLADESLKKNQNSTELTTTANQKQESSETTKQEL